MPYSVRNLTLGIVVYNLYMCRVPCSIFQSDFSEMVSPVFLGYSFRERYVWRVALKSVCSLYRGQPPEEPPFFRHTLIVW